ncbi:MAG: phosphotransferase [Pseudomonadota bacterium]
MRRSDIQDFIADAGWQNAVMTPLAGDASRRRYLRLVEPETGDRAVLMDAPTDHGEDVRPFVSVAGYLRSIGLSSPEILDARADLGLLLIEDLGDDLFARLTLNEPKLETLLYQNATDLLVRLHLEKPPENLASYTPTVMVEQSALILDWYSGNVSKSVSEKDKEEFTNVLFELLSEHASVADVLVQRDYHSENLIWLPDRVGIKRVGLLDFQDATLGHRMYDLVSLLQDARRDVSPDIETAMRRRYADATGCPVQSSDVAYAVLGAQRTLRIIGVFARLAIRDSKPHYLELMPRVWDLLQRNLAHPALADLAQITHDLIPEPSDAIKKTLRQRCDTTPAQS